MDWLDDDEERGLGVTKTNREWLMQKLINMSDDKFADVVCDSELWSCDNCRASKINNYGYCQGCKEEFCKWLKQEHKEG